MVTHVPWDAAAREPWFRFASEAAPPFTSTRAALPTLQAYHTNSRDAESGLLSRPNDVFGWFGGDRDFGANTAAHGTYPTMSVSQGGQYGPAHAVLMRYRSSGNLGDLRRGEDMIRFALNTSLVSWATIATDACHRSYVPAGREPLTLAATMHSGEPAIDNNYLAYNDVANYYFLTGDRRVVDILRSVPLWPSFHVGEEMPGRGQFGREFYAPFAAFLDAWEVLGDNREMCVALGSSCPGAEAEERPAGGELAALDAQQLFKGIKAMRDLASGIPVYDRPNVGEAMLDASAIASLQPDRMAPDAENPVYDTVGTCESGPGPRTRTRRIRAFRRTSPASSGLPSRARSPT